MADIDILPRKREKQRACLLCSLIKTHRQFLSDGCENCEDLLSLKSSAKRIQDCTSANFDGHIALINPASSWVAKWQRTGKFECGLYAIRVAGSLPEEVVDRLADAGIQYRIRDGSIVE